MNEARKYSTLNGVRSGRMKDACVPFGLMHSRVIFEGADATHSPGSMPAAGRSRVGASLAASVYRTRTSGGQEIGLAGPNGARVFAMVTPVIGGPPSPVFQLPAKALGGEWQFVGTTGHFSSRLIGRMARRDGSLLEMSINLDSISGRPPLRPIKKRTNRAREKNCVWEVLLGGKSQGVGHVCSGSGTSRSFTKSQVWVILRKSVRRLL